MGRGILVERPQRSQLVGEIRILPIEEARGVSSHCVARVIDGVQPERGVHPEVAVSRVEDGRERGPAIAVALVERDERIKIGPQPQSHSLIARCGVRDQEEAPQEILWPMQQRDLIEQPAMTDEHLVSLLRRIAGCHDDARCNQK